MDFSQTYLLHTFHSRTYEPEGFTRATVLYVLARDSNYALAAWSTVKHMVDHGVVREDNVEP